MKETLRTIFLGAFGIAVAAILLFLPFGILVSHEQQIQKEKIATIEKANKKPTLYEIAYTDGYKDSVKVYGDFIELEQPTNFFGDKGEIYVRYIPYRKYTNDESFDNDYKTIYNVLRIKKIE